MAGGEKNKKLGELSPQYEALLVLLQQRLIKKFPDLSPDLLRGLFIYWVAPLKALGLSLRAGEPFQDNVDPILNFSKRGRSGSEIYNNPRTLLRNLHEILFVSYASFHLSFTHTSVIQTLDTYLPDKEVNAELESDLEHINKYKEKIKSCMMAVSDLHDKFSTLPEFDSLMNSDMLKKNFLRNAVAAVIKLALITVIISLPILFSLIVFSALLLAPLGAAATLLCTASFAAPLTALLSLSALRAGFFSSLNDSFRKVMAHLKPHLADRLLLTPEERIKRIEAADALKGALENFAAFTLDEVALVETPSKISAQDERHKDAASDKPPEGTAKQLSQFYNKARAHLGQAQRAMKEEKMQGLVTDAITKATHVAKNAVHPEQDAGISKRVYRVVNLGTLRR